LPHPTIRTDSANTTAHTDHDAGGLIPRVARHDASEERGINPAASWRAWFERATRQDRKSGMFRSIFGCFRNTLHAWHDDRATRTGIWTARAARRSRAGAKGVPAWTTDVEFVLRGCRMIVGLSARPAPALLRPRPRFQRVAKENPCPHGCAKRPFKPTESAARLAHVGDVGMLRFVSWNGQASTRCRYFGGRGLRPSWMEKLCR
jgi:hypothetical protein